jgi:hypothetical protein
MVYVDKMTRKIDPFDRIVPCPLIVIVIVVVLILVYYSLFLSTSFISVGKALQEPVVTTAKVNSVSSKVTSANTNTTPSVNVNVISMKVASASHRVVSAQTPKEFPQTLLSSYRITNAQGVYSERVLSENSNTTNALNYNVPHTQRSISNVS